MTSILMLTCVIWIIGVSITILLVGDWSISIIPVDRVKTWYIIPTITFSKYKYDRNISFLWLNVCIKFYWFSGEWGY